MYILGINGGHNGTAALLEDGEVKWCISEERFSRIKNHVGFPYSSVEYILKEEGIKPKDLDYIIIAKNVGQGVEKEGKPFNMFKKNYSSKNLFKRILGYLIYKFPSIFNPLIDFKHSLTDNIKQEKLEKENIDYLSKYYDIGKEKIIYADHHLLHAMSVCFNLPKNKKSLIFTLDAEGVGEKNEKLCSSVNIFDGKKIRRISKTGKEASLGYLYGITTLFLGMKPNEHEFKVMGMAPYSKEEYVKKIYPLFRDILWVEGLNFKSRFKMQYADSYFKDKAIYKRFDNLAGGIQKLAEDLTTKWIRNGIKKTGIHNIALSGGVFMNVKANQKIADMEEVKSIFPMPSAGDECMAIGGCFYGYMKYCKDKSKKLNPKPIKDLYLGPKYSDEEVENFLKKNGYFKKYKIKKFKNIEKKIAKLLSKNKIVARLNGRSEWGARALGNRSILANPSNKDTVRILNEQIKNRDFWMPFTPSILEEDLKRYIKNPKKLDCPYMIVTFDGTEKSKKDLCGAIHPYDFTVRPQEVYKKWNPSYYRIIKEFKNFTGIGGVLNTSFNLHGRPIVLSPKDALYTFENSGLKYLALNNYLVEKS